MIFSARFLPVAAPIPFSASAFITVLSADIAFSSAFISVLLSSLFFKPVLSLSILQPDGPAV